MNACKRKVYYFSIMAFSQPAPFFFLFFSSHLLLISSLTVQPAHALSFEFLHFNSHLHGGWCCLVQLLACTMMRHFSVPLDRLNMCKRVEKREKKEKRKMVVGIFPCVYLLLNVVANGLPEPKFRRFFLSTFCFFHQLFSRLRDRFLFSKFTFFLENIFFLFRILSWWYMYIWAWAERLSWKRSGKKKKKKIR